MNTHGLRLLILMLGGMLWLAGPICGDPEEVEDSGATATLAAVETSTPDLAGTVITPIPGLTDTGYKALDGRPLYAECIAPHLSLPPVLPTPVGTAAPDPTATPGDPNTGKATPDRTALPRLDLSTTSTLDTSNWVLQERACYGYSFALPEDWAIEAPFTHAGYQLGEMMIVASPSGEVRLEVGVYFSPSKDYVQDGLRIGGLQDYEYLLEPPRRLAVSSLEAVEGPLLLSQNTGNTYRSYTIRLRPDWFATFTYFARPSSSLDELAPLAGIVSSIESE